MSDKVTEAIYRAEEAHRASEERFKKVFNASPHAMTISTVDEGRYIDVNEATLRITGFTRAEMVGHTTRELNVWVDSQDRNRLLGMLEEQGEVREFEVRLRSKNGDVHTLLMAAETIDIDGKRCLLTVSSDITDRKRAEEAIEFQALLLAMVEQAVMATDLEGKIIYWNRFAEKLYGWSAREAVGRNVMDVTPAEKMKEQAAEIMERLTEGQSWSGEFLVRRRDGSAFWSLITDSPIHDSNGNLIGVVGISVDITERKRAEEAQRFLAEASSILATSLDYETTLMSLARLATPRLATYCAIDLVDEDNKLRQVAVAHMDPQKEEMVRELRRHSPYNYTLPYGVAKVLRTGKSEISPDIPDSLITSFGTGDDYLRIIGELNPKSYMIVPLIARGRTLGAISFVADGSSTRYDSKSLELAEALAHRAAFAIDNARLYGEVQRANRAKDEFLATVSHELRTPLNAILGWSHILRSSKLDEAATANAHTIIERNARAQARLIEDILDISRIITGKLRLDVRPTGLDLVVAAAVEAMRPAADVKKITIETKISAEACAVSGDASRLQQVVWNLISNAIKFTPNGGRVEVKLDRHGASARLTVRDTGQGISKAFLPYVFDRFRQADATTTRKHSGLGLGLAIVRHLVELHGGTTDVESEGEGRGATFTIMLPLAGIERAAGETAPEQEAKTTERRPAILEGLRLVIVDDQTDTLEMLKTSLAALGATVAGAATAREALKMVIETLPHVLVSDLGLPEEDGYELIRKVRELAPELGGLTPAIALTAYARAEDRRQALEAGFQIHMTKPVEHVELAVVIAGLAGRTVKGFVA
ncbi:MAG TPA: PAS domain S-box protein [Blastocatellia bacterium]|nr:PAS domain S-box protein [Blastocatellia bacterium]